MNKILFGSRDIKKRNNSELTSLSTDFNLLIELQWNIVDFICILSMSLRNSLGKFFVPVLWPVMQNLVSTDDVYYRFWWSATYCSNHLVNDRADLMLLSYFGCKYLRAKMQVCFGSLWSALLVDYFCLKFHDHICEDGVKCVHVYMLLNAY